jgi:hypothetical protein
MAESIYRGIQLGVETTYGTQVAATTVYPVDEGSGEFELNRATRFPEEDFGTQVAFLSSRGSHGVRIGTGSLTSDARFEDLGHLLQMSIGAAAYTGAGPYTQTYTAGATTDTTKSYSVEVTNDVQTFTANGVKCTSLELSFDAINAGENSPWKVNAELQANNVVKDTATAALTIPTTLETIEGHLTRIYQGTTATAFASLAELEAHLVQYSLRIEQPKPLRPYGSTVDYATSIGLGKRRATFNAMLKLSASTVSDVYDIFDASGGAVSERRWRIVAAGSGTKTLTIDHRVAFMNVTRDPSGREGEYLLSVEGNATYDATLASDLKIVIAGVANATLP